MTMRLLVVDDQSEVRDLVKMILETEYPVAREAANGMSALEAARQDPPDCIILDVRMPGPLDGFEVCKAIKQDPQLRSIGVILLTALATPESRAAGHAVGADGYLVKPFSFNALLDKVAELQGLRPCDDGAR